MLRSHSLANSWCYIFAISSTEQIFSPSLCSVQFWSCINLNHLQSHVPRHLTATLISGTEGQQEAKLNRFTLWPRWKMSERRHDRATEEDNQLVVMEDNWKQRDWKKAKKSEEHKEDMDASKGLLTVPGTVIIRGGNRHCWFARKYQPGYTLTCWTASWKKRVQVLYESGFTPRLKPVSTNVL